MRGSGCRPRERGAAAAELQAAAATASDEADAPAAPLSHLARPEAFALPWAIDHDFGGVWFLVPKIRAQGLSNQYGVWYELRRAPQ
eukprot:1047212-Rhodomonas_salina.1